MKVIGVVLVAFYEVVATALSSSATGAPASPAPVGGNPIDLDCSKGSAEKASVSRPNTTVTVTCGEKSTVEPMGGKDIFLGAECTEEGVLSSVCPGATVTPVNDTGRSGGKKKVNVSFTQLPPSAQVVCLKCNNSDGGCRAVIDVAAAPPQGPQACAVAGSSVTLQIKEAGGSAQFTCGTGLTLMPREATKAYADNCTEEETLKDMTRSLGPENYVTFRVNKLKKKKMCFLCKQGAADAKQGGEQTPCTVYVEVSAGTRLSSNLGLACVAAVLHFT